MTNLQHFSSDVTLTACTPHTIQFLVVLLTVRLAFPKWQYHIITPTDTPLTPYWHPTHTLPSPYWNTTNTLLTPYWHPTNTLLTTHQHPTDIPPHPTDTPPTPYWHPTNTLLTPHQHTTDTPPITYWQFRFRFIQLVRKSNNITCSCIKLFSSLTIYQHFTDNWT